MCPSFRATGDERHSTRGRARLLQELMTGELADRGMALGGGARRAGPVPGLQGLRVGLPDLGGHGLLQVGVPASPLPATAASALPLRAGLAADLAAPGRADAPGREHADPWPTDPGCVRAGGRHRARAVDPALARTLVPARVPSVGGRARAARGWPRATRTAGVVLWPDTFNDHLTPEVAACRGAGAGCGGVRGGGAGAGGLLRAHMDDDRPAGHRAADPAADVGRSRARRSRADRGAGGVLRGDAADRPAGAAAGRSPRGIRCGAGADAGGGARRRGVPRHVGPVGATTAVASPALSQPHCHHQAVLGLAADRRVRERNGIAVGTELAGCCGLAGNFGAERGHGEVSRKVAALALQPALDAAAAETPILADGFSCRTQIEALSGRRATSRGSPRRSAAAGLLARLTIRRERARPGRACRERPSGPASRTRRRLAQDETPRTAATAGFRYVMAVARTDPTSVMSRDGMPQMTANRTMPRARYRVAGTLHGDGERWPLRYTPGPAGRRCAAGSRSGRGAVWQRAAFGTLRSEVQILSPRPNSRFPNSNSAGSAALSPSSMASGVSS